MSITDFTEKIVEERVVVDLVIEHLEYAKLVVRSHNDELVLAKSIDAVRLRDILNALKLEQGESLEGIGLYGEVSQMESAQETDQIQEFLEQTEETWAEHASNLTLQKLCDRLNDPMESGDSASSKTDRRGYGRHQFQRWLVWRQRCRPHHLVLHLCSIEPIDIIGTLCV